VSPNKALQPTPLRPLGCDVRSLATLGTAELTVGRERAGRLSSSTGRCANQRNRTLLLPRLTYSHIGLQYRHATVATTSDVFKAVGGTAATPDPQPSRPGRAVVMRSPGRSVSSSLKSPKHLRVLRQVGLVSVRDSGRQRGCTN